MKESTTKRSQAKKTARAAEQAALLHSAAQAPALVREIVSARVLLAERRGRYVASGEATAAG